MGQLYAQACVCGAYNYAFNRRAHIRIILVRPICFNQHWHQAYVRFGEYSKVHLIEMIARSKASSDNL